MVDKNIAKQSLAYAAGAVGYIALVAVVMSKAEELFGDMDQTVLAPIGFLLLLVISVATMGMLIFGKPVMLYMDGQKKDGVTMAITTISILAGFTVLLLLGVAAM